MLTCVPASCDDELDFSIFARYCIRKPYSNKRAFVEELFGKRTSIATVGFTSNITHFIQELAPGHHYSIDEFINKHTFLPYHALFLAPHQVVQLREDMCIGNGPGIHMRAGLMASKIPLAAFLKICPACIEQDREQYGFCYWHRKHQPFGVEVCADHSIPLLHTNVPTTNRQTRYEFITAEQAVKYMNSLIPSASLPFHDILLALARSVAWGLEQRSWSPGLALIRERYLALLDQHGLSTVDKHVRLEGLYQQFRAMYPTDLLCQLCCELDECEDTWLTRLVRKPKHAQHPLYHLLLMHLFGHSAQSFFTFDLEKKGFGEGPWPCLNPVCDDYHQLVICVCKVYTSRYVGEQLIGTFACPSCEFTYARTWSSKVMDPFIRQRVVMVGRVWEAWLQDNWSNKSHSLRDLARRLGVDPKTVKEHAARLGLPFPRSGGFTSVPQHWPTDGNKPREVTQEVRSRDQHVILCDRTESVQNIDSAKGYTKESAGQPYIGCKLEHVQRGRVDWSERDQKIKAQIPLAAEALRHAPGRPRQVTVAAIGRYLGLLALLQRHSDKLPLTRKALDEVAETRILWAIRRIQYVVDQARQNNIILTEWQLIRSAGVVRLLDEEEVRVALTEAMVILGENKL